MAFDLAVRPASDSRQGLGSMWTTALAQYEELTGTRPSISDELESLEEFVKETAQMQAKFEKFRHDDSKHDRLRSLIARSLGPIQLLGNIVARATKAAFLPSKAIFAAIRYLNSSASAVWADFSKIESFFNELQLELNSLKVLEGHITPIPELEAALM
ncbi:putative Ankyrin repeat-containing domain protein [Seiridium cardinale]